MKPLEQFPRHRLAHLPTPLEALARIATDSQQTLFIKRDDATGLAFGGNKTRKLEFLIGQALAEGAQRVLTFGAVQSNHARQTAAAAAAVGLPCDLVLVRAVPERPSSDDQQGNTLLDRLLGARLHIVADEQEAEEVAIRLLTETPATYLIPPGGSTPVGCLGYVAAAFELAEQCRERGIRPSRIVLAASTGGTVAGLRVGLAVADFSVPVTAVAVYDSATNTREKIETLTQESLAFLELSSNLCTEIEVTDRFLGPGYGIATPASIAAVRRAAQSEGILLDPIYTGKAMAAFLEMAANADKAADHAPLLFWHTGGAPAVFAYAPTLL